MNFKKLMIGIVVILISAVWIYTNCSNDENTISLIEEESFFVDFEKRGEDVLIYCELVIENSYTSSKKIKIEGIFTEDYMSGFLKEETLEAYSMDMIDSIFILEKGINRIEIVFSGTSGGFDKKANKLLPDINIFEVGM